MKTVRQMNTKTLTSALVLAGAMGFIACASDKDEINPNVFIDENGTASVQPEFVISIPHSVVKGTRMASDATQADGTVAQFRGLSGIQLVPFNTAPTGTTSKWANVMNLGDIATAGSMQSVGDVNYKVYANESTPLNTSHFLMYAKATDTSGDKFKYGSLVASGMGSDFTTPSGVQIGLEQINPNKAAIADDATGQALLTMLSSIANISGWSTATNTVLQDLRTGFLSMQVCASDYVSVILNDLYFSASHVDMTDADYSVSRAICTAIEAVGTPKSGDKLALNAAYAGFPANLNLPDGATAIEWNGTAFVDATSVPEAPFNRDLRQYSYPAALWYYVNTPIKASENVESPKYNDEVIKNSEKGDSEPTDATETNEKVEEWTQVINNIYAGASDVVTENTQSVALVKPAQYGVGRLELRLKIVGDEDGKVYDHNGDEMDVTNGFTLKGLLVGGQTIAKYDFTTDGLTYDGQSRTIYDRDVPSGIVVKLGDLTTVKNHTLGLETLPDQAIKIALELVNNGPTFMGKTGLIHSGSTFYLAATLDPRSLSTTGYVAGSVDRIFLQDHVTKVNISIRSGKDPGTGPGEGGPTVPDLSSETIELGTSVDLEWVEGLSLTPEI